MARITNTHAGTITLDTPEGYCECPATFDVEGERYPAEPYSWGGSRGYEVEARAELLTAQLGGLLLGRSQVEAIIGPDALRAQEDRAADMFLDTGCAA